MANLFKNRDDFCFIVPEQNRGWILDALCHEVERFCSGKCSFVYFPCNFLPSSQTYFLAHFSLLRKCFKEFPEMEDSQVFVFFTHLPSHLEEKSVVALTKASKIICMNTYCVQYLVEKGIARDKVVCVIGGADSSLFIFHSRSNGVVGLSTAYYPRKSPDRVFEIVKAMPHRPFLLLGRGWEKYKHFSELRKLENFTYVETDYRSYPSYYAQMDVFVSPSFLEGGPIPLIEAMMCNAVPVASNTGFAPDIICHGENGFIFDTDSSTENVCSLIDAAFGIKTNIRETVVDLTWGNFSRQIQAFQHERLGEMEIKLRQRRLALEKAQNKLGDVTIELKDTARELRKKDRELKSLQKELDLLRKELDLLRNSEFWIIWKRYLALKGFLGF